MEKSIVVRGLGKRYELGAREHAVTNIREAIASLASAPRRWIGRGRSADPEEFWALRDVSFEVAEGEVLGIIGRNGAGKSTLLKILSRITSPTEGWAEVRGRIGALLEVGTGFHPELTGRENIFLNGSILGLSLGEIKKRFDEIVAFSGVERFIDTPLKHYSSGMHVRLGFAVAAHLEPDVLLLDEVLAVGDVAFQRKCVGKISEVGRQGRTIIFLSHDLPAVQSLCERTIVLDAGRIVFEGPSSDAIGRYLASQVALVKRRVGDRTDRSGSGALRFVEAWIEDSAGRPVETVRTGEEIRIVLKYETGVALRDVEVAVNIHGLLGHYISDLWSEGGGAHWPELPKEGRIVCTLPRLALNAGHYMLNLHAAAETYVVDHVDDAVGFDVVGGDFFGTGKMPDPRWGSVLLEQRWSLA